MKTTTEKNDYFLLFSYNFYDVRITTMSVFETTRTNEKKKRADERYYLVSECNMDVPTGNKSR